MDLNQTSYESTLGWGALEWEIIHILFVFLINKAPLSFSIQIYNLKP